MKTILLTVDFSSFTKYLIDKTIELAKPLGAKIHLFHVASLDLGVIIGENGYSYIPELEKSGLGKEAEELEGLKKYIEEQGVACEVNMKQGIPSELIMKEADDIKADIISIASLGHSGIYKVLIGSVASATIKNAKIPLYVVPIKN